MKKSKTPTLTINQQSLTPINPITKNQQTAFEEWKDGNHLVLAGSAGTGKTFLAMYFAFDELFKDDSLYERVVLFDLQLQLVIKVTCLETAKKKKMRSQLRTNKSVVSCLKILHRMVRC